VTDESVGQVEDPLAQAKEAESVLLTAISLLPLLSFSRRTQSSPGSKEIFGSVTSTDILASMREYGVVVDESNGAVKEGEGVDRGRIKALGRFDCESFSAP
jgi:ribosomal protein L9